jgi:phosphatidate cytidylyltransferase
MLKQRVITACILALLSLWVVLKLPQAGFGAVVAAVMLLGAWEWAALAGLHGTRDRLLYVGLVLALMLGGWTLLDQPWFVGSVLILATLAWCGAGFWLWRFTVRPERHDSCWLIGLAGLAALVPPWVAMMALRAQYTPGHVLFLLLLIWGADVGAYFAGRRWGRRKLALAISPGKTWEGVAGAGAMTLVLAVIGAAALGFGSHWPAFTAICLITIVFSIAGDLFESMLKRQCGIKDSGSLLPGHGGILDRIDSLTAAAPIFLLGLYGLPT